MNLYFQDGKATFSDPPCAGDRLTVWQYGGGYKDYLVVSIDNCTLTLAPWTRWQRFKFRVRWKCAG